ncbi:hypothetical protein HMN09_00976100 [Mycena chlorophos]|uniref:Uncharacterized protein n=1 Tax=Mycena chlorophos TaxID=658473 RepID=A0A8H6SHF5_MYCCL|nr:hypothetical protein HMN09_00976100 [Mycena chlorophos]
MLCSLYIDATTRSLFSRFLPSPSLQAPARIRVRPLTHMANISAVYDAQGWYSYAYQFPDHDPCFDPDYSAYPLCQNDTTANVTNVMLAFLNITNFDSYFAAYCLSPPDDSCPWGYCPNPDVASPAVRYSTYFTTVMSAILVLYSPSEVTSTFFSQLLNVYSIIIAALVAIAKKNLTKPHAAVALGLACSPLSIYLIIYVIRSLIGNPNRLQGVFGPGMWLSRLSVLMLVPVWFTLLGLEVAPDNSWRFQQSACDEIVAEHRIVRDFFEPMIVFFELYAPLSAVIFAVLAITWGVAIFLRRKEIWKPGKGKFPVGRMWRKVVDRYPFIQFCTVVLIPHAAWMFNSEIGVAVMLPRERFSWTYGQLLAVLVTIPPLLQLGLLMPRLFWWFVDLAWVRAVTCRRHKPRHTARRRSTRRKLEPSEMTEGDEEGFDFHDRLPLVEAAPRMSLDKTNVDKVES